MYKSSDMFFGVVEDNNDPLKLGRVRVRVFGHHTSDAERIKTSDLPWATPMQPITSAAMGDIGTSPTGIVQGSWVLGIFLDGNTAQRPIIMGTFAGIPSSDDVPDTMIRNGFKDPDGVYPQRTGEPDINRLARNDSGYSHSVTEQKSNNVKRGVAIALSGTWDQLVIAFNAIYPFNSVRQTRSGHIKEYDDTPNNERIHEYHKAGTYYEIGPDGSRVLHVVGDNYTAILGSNFVSVDGACNITAGTLTLKAGTIKIEADDFDIKAGTYNKQVTGEQHIRNEGDIHSFTGADSYSRHDDGTNYSCPTDPVRLSDIDCSDVDIAE